MLDRSTYVSFELAKLLKDKGYDGFCLAHYDKDGNFHFNEIEEGCDINLFDILRCYNFDSEYIFFDAPRLPDLINWLLVEHDMLVNVFFEVDNEGKGYFSYLVHDISLKNGQLEIVITSKGEKYNSRNEATIKVIERILNKIDFEEI